MDGNSAQKGALRTLKEKVLIMRVPAYGNKLFYSLGFLALTSLVLLIISGVVMVFEGPTWWLASSWGIFFRSIHLWAAQAFILVILLHVLVVFTTSGFKTPRRLTWIIGSIVFVLALVEAEFGYGLRGDFSSQFRVLQGADFFNGAFLGKIINTLNYAQIYGIHIIDVPLAMLALVLLHYLFVKVLGIAKPYRKEVKVRTVPANHRKLFMRGAVLTAVIVALALIFPSPLVSPKSIQEVAKDDPALMAQTLLAEFTRTSDTATYFDSIDPYAYDTRAVYVSIPYGKYVAITGVPDALAAFSSESAEQKRRDIAQVEEYFNNNGPVNDNAENPLISVVSSLIVMGRNGVYEPTVDAENQNVRPMYSLRFLSDTGILENEASALHMTTDQWGMMREETGIVPPGAWWLAPIGVLDHTVLANDENGDRDGAEILGIIVLLFVFFPFIPYVNRLPEKLHLAEYIWKTEENGGSR